jgi:hypothetical protein
MMNKRTKHTLVATALLVLLAAVVVAARPAPQEAGWEYAVFVGADDGRAAWVSADTILIESDMRYMLLALGDHELPEWTAEDERWGPMILNHLGARGWELTDVVVGGFRGDNLGPLDEPHRTYYLKRSTI